MGAAAPATPAGPYDAGSMPPPPLTAVIPLKALADAKQRLATALPPSRRQELTAWMFDHVVSTCRRAPSIEAVLVIAGDAAGADLAARAGVPVLLEPRRGLDAAMAAADAALADAPATLVVTADLPLLSVEDVEGVCRAGADARAVVIAPTRDGGTGGLLRRPPAIMGTAYGPGSAASHRTLAIEAGVAPIVVSAPGFSHDVDTAGQLHAARLSDPRLGRWAG